MDGWNDLFRLEKGEEEVKKRTLATPFSPPFDFKTPPRHSFHPSSKSFGTCESLFCRFQNRLICDTLAALINQYQFLAFV